MVDGTTTILSPVVCVSWCCVGKKEGLGNFFNDGWELGGIVEIVQLIAVGGVFFSSLPPAAERRGNKNLGTLPVCNFFCRAVKVIGGLGDLISGSWSTAVG